MQYCINFITWVSGTRERNEMLANNAMAKMQSTVKMRVFMALLREMASAFYVSQCTVRLLFRQITLASIFCLVALVELLKSDDLCKKLQISQKLINFYYDFRNFCQKKYFFCAFFADSVHRSIVHSQTISIIKFTIHLNPKRDIPHFYFISLIKTCSFLR